MVCLGNESKRGIAMSTAKIDLDDIRPRAFWNFKAHYLTVGRHGFEGAILNVGQYHTDRFLELSRSSDRIGDIQIGTVRTPQLLWDLAILFALTPHWMPFGGITSGSEWFA